MFVHVISSSDAGRLNQKWYPPPPVIVVSVSGSGGSSASALSPPLRGSTSKTNSPEAPGTIAMFEVGTPATICATTAGSVVASFSPCGTFVWKFVSWNQGEDREAHVRVLGGVVAEDLAAHPPLVQPKIVDDVTW